MRLAHKDRPIVTAEQARELLAYDRESGLLTWKVNRRGKVKAGDAAAHLRSGGYLIVCLLDRLYPAHRIIWLMMTGKMPAQVLDHINRDRTDNRWCNLRESTARQNCHNRGLSSLSTTGRKGVTYSAERRRYRVIITSDGHRRHIGYFRDIDQAAAAYDQAALKYHGNFNYKGGTMAKSIVNGHGL